MPMPMSLDLVYLFVVACVSATIRGTAGIGAAILFIPLASLFLPTKEAIVISAISDMVGGGYLYVQDLRRKRDDRQGASAAGYRRLVYLIPGALAGILLGFYVFESFSSDWLGAGVGLLAAGIGAFFLFAAWRVAEQRRTAADRKPSAGEDLMIGGASGLFGSLFGMPGIPLTVYLGLQLEKVNFRRLIVPLLFAIAALRVTMYLLAGLIALEHGFYVAVLIPAIVLGSVLGTWFNQVVSQKFFDWIVGLLLIASGLRLFVSGIGGP